MIGSTRKFRALLVAAAAAALTTAWTGTASAAAYDGTDPISTGCASSAITARSAYGPVSGTKQLLVELRYSTRCATTWARITTLNMPACVGNTDYCGYVTVHRNSDGLEYSCATPSGTHGCYTLQVNDNRVTSYAYGFVDNGATTSSATTGSYLRGIS
ncbi:DUF2690 domain-containing protein [Amycolatopsis sp. NPDC004747]